jgi:uncharacterized membrane protein YesL
MAVNFVSYKLRKLFVCVMCFQMFFVCINHFPQFTSFLLDLFKSVKEAFYCIFSWFSNVIVAARGLEQL